MAFIVKKIIHGRDYFYLNENKRINGKVKTKTLAYLGKRKKEAEKKAKEIIKMLEKNKKEMGDKKEKEFMKEKSLIPPNQPPIAHPKTEEKIEKTEMMKKELSMKNINELTNFCKRKGFVYPSAEIYGGFAGFWDFGHLGVELINNIKKEWWKFHVQEREDVVGIDGSIITNPKVWEASGHISGFLDVAVVCKACGYKTKIDKYEAEKIEKIKCEKCQGEYEIKEEFNPMFFTQVGPIKEDSIQAYLRPETAQLIFTNFKNVYENARMKLPFGIAQIGKAFRNEIAPRDFLFRAREFEQMEIEYFIKPGQKCPFKLGESKSQILVYSEEMQLQKKDPEKMTFKQAYEKEIINDWHAYWLEQEFLWFISLGANPEKFRIRQHLKDEKSHYALDTWDLEYRFPFGWKELEGIANRTDFDLKQHEKFSGRDLKIFDEQSKEKILPYVVCEPSLGTGRTFLVFMFDAYYYDEERGNVVLKLCPKLSPIKAAIFPIVRTNKKFVKMAKEIFNELKEEFNIVYDESGSIGRRYSRQDEIGVPIAITVDEQSLKDDTITLRDRDSTEQIRIKIKDIKDVLRRAIDGENILELGKKVNTRKKLMKKDKK